MTHGAAIRPLPQQKRGKICVALQTCDMQGSLSVLWGGFHRSERRRQGRVRQSAEGQRRPSSPVGLHQRYTQIHRQPAAAQQVTGGYCGTHRIPRFHAGTRCDQCIRAGDVAFVRGLVQRSPPRLRQTMTAPHAGSV